MIRSLGSVKRKSFKLNVTNDGSLMRLKYDFYLKSATKD